MGERGNKADGKSSGLAAFPVLGGADTFFRLPKNAAAVLEKLGADRCERDPMGVAVEETNANFFLQLSDLRAQGRLGDVKKVSGPPEVQGLTDGVEVAEMTEFHSGQ